MDRYEDFHAGVKRRAEERNRQAELDNANDQADIQRQRARRAAEDLRAAKQDMTATEEECREARQELEEYQARMEEEIAAEKSARKHAEAGLVVALRALRSLVATTDAFTAADCSDDAYPALRQAWREAVELLHVVDGTQPVGELPPIPAPEVPPIPPHPAFDLEFPDLPPPT